MRAAILRYKIYKDRFYLSIVISLILHILGIALYYSLPIRQIESKIRPISLGMLRPSSIQTSQDSALENLDSNIPNPSALNPSHAQTNARQLKKSADVESAKTRVNKTPQARNLPSAQGAKPIASIKEDSASLQTRQTAQAERADLVDNKEEGSRIQEKKEAPSPNIDLQTLSIPDDHPRFNPLSTRSPSLSESLKRYDDNVSLESLPSSVKDKLYKLYGSELNNMSKEEKDYLADSYFINAEVFQQTADRMGYPRLARLLEQQGNGVIEFMLNPDGSVTDIRIVSSTGYESLDDSMQMVVEQSAKSLKRPPKPIKVRLGGEYRIRPGLY